MPNIADFLLQMPQLPVMDIAGRGPPNRRRPGGFEIGTEGAGRVAPAGPRGGLHSFHIAPANSNLGKLMQSVKTPAIAPNSGLVVSARFKNGRVIEGKPGQTHGNLAQDMQVDLGRAELGFSVGGRFMTRAEALKFIGK